MSLNHYPAINPLTFELIPPSRRDPFASSVLSLVDVKGDLLMSPPIPSWAASSQVGPGRCSSPSPSQLSWGATWVDDEVINSYSLAPDNTIVSGLITTSGLSIVALSILASLTIAAFNPNEIFFAFLNDIDGIDFETPPDLENETPSRRAEQLFAARPQFGGPPYGRVFTMPSYLSAGFRLWVYARNPGAPVMLTVKIKTA
jgi:hypothetical protein